MGKKATVFMNWLSEEGYRPTLDDDGDVQFKYEGLTFILFGEEEDSTYFRLVLPAFHEFSDENSKAVAYLAAVEIAHQYKVAKIYFVKDTAWAAAEMFIDPIENFSKVLERCLKLLVSAGRDFVNRMEEE